MSSAAHETLHRPRSRVRLAAPDPALLEAAAPWLGRALLDMAGGPHTDPELEPHAWLASDDGTATAVLILVDGKPVGVARFTVEGGVLLFGELAVDPEQRNLGYGVEAVAAVEAAAGAVGIAQAPVPLGNGLAVYFWLRAGYRPLFASAGGRAGVTVMERRLG